MEQNVNGLRVTVSVKEGVPHIRVQMSGGDPVLDTDALSATGLRNLARALNWAADIAAGALERYWRTHNRAHDVNTEGAA